MPDSPRPLPTNPYRPGAGHMPPHVAGRIEEYAEFDRLLGQTSIMENMILTGLRGLGKTVLLETLRPRAQGAGWLWAGTDLSESASVTEANLALRLITDLSVVTSAFEIEIHSQRPGFGVPDVERVPLGYKQLLDAYDSAPGLTADKLKTVLKLAHDALTGNGHSGRVIFAYDEAQNLFDSKDRDQYPLTVLLEVFQSIQRAGVPFMLVLTGLPTLFPKLVEARTYAERMFRVITLDRLSEDESRDAILKPLEGSTIGLHGESVDVIIRQSGGYPYFIQFICREAFDVFIQQATEDVIAPVPLDAIQRKLDADFFAARWTKVTDRQRQLLYVAASLHAPEEFSLQDLAEKSKELLEKGFSTSHANQILGSLTLQGLIYKNRFGKYSFAVPLLDEFILRTFNQPENLG